MRCPTCGFPDTKVLESRVPLEGDAVRRRRECASCGKRFTTFEKAERPPLFVVKRDGTRQLFDRAKLLKSLETACRKRPVPSSFLDAAAERVERRLLDEAEAEVPTSQVGQAVLVELYDLDRVAYVRFASVYAEFESVEDFERLIADVDRRPGSPNEQPALLVL